MIQYSYNGKFRVGQSGSIGALSDSQLADDALVSLRALATKSGAEQPNPFIQEFLDRLDAAIANAEIQRTGYKSMPHRLRVSFAASSRKGEIDFTYDGSSTWTAAQEVGGPGNTQGLFEEVQHLMSVRQGEQQ